SASAIAPELRSFGFDVAETDPVQGDGRLPCSDAEFEVAVCLLASSSDRSQREHVERLALEAGRVLRAGGRLLLTLAQSGADGLAQGGPKGPPLHLRPLEVAEMLAQSDNESPLKVILPAQRTSDSVPPRGFLFIDARRVDAPPR